MDKSSFSSNLAHNGEFSLEDKLEIMGEKNRYPYCAPLQMLDLLSDKAVALYHWEDISHTRFISSFYTNSIWLDKERHYDVGRYFFNICLHLFAKLA